MKSVVLTLFAVVVSASACEVGSTRVAGSFWYECVAHPRAGASERPGGCVVYDENNVQKNVDFGTETFTGSNKNLQGVIRGCKFDGSKLQLTIEGCWVYDLKEDKSVRVNHGEYKAVFPFDIRQQYKFTCKKEADGSTSYSYSI